LGPEDRFKAKIVRKLRDIGAWVYSTPRSRFGRAGIPDILAIYKGCFLAIEVKRPDGKGDYTVTPTQTFNLCRIAENDGHAICIDSEEKFKELFYHLLTWKDGHG
jgi:Holliday junction resolvase